MNLFVIQKASFTYCEKKQFMIFAFVCNRGLKHWNLSISEPHQVTLIEYFPLVSILIILHEINL